MCAGANRWAESAVHQPGVHHAIRWEESAVCQPGEAWNVVIPIHYTSVSTPAALPVQRSVHTTAVICHMLELQVLPRLLSIAVTKYRLLERNF